MTGPSRGFAAPKPPVPDRVAAAELVNAARQAMGSTENGEAPRRKDDPKDADYAYRRKPQIQTSERLERVLETLEFRLRHTANGNGGGGGPGKAISIGMIITIAGGFLTFIAISQLVVNPSVKPIEQVQVDHGRRLTTAEAKLDLRVTTDSMLRELSLIREELALLRADKRDQNGAIAAIAARVNELETKGTSLAREAREAAGSNRTELLEFRREMNVLRQKIDDLPQRRPSTQSQGSR